MRTALKASLLIVMLTGAAANANAWFCTAESKNGASGWGFHFFQSESEKTALRDCRSHSHGHICRITSCW